VQPSENEIVDCVPLIYLVGLLLLFPKSYVGNIIHASASIFNLFRV